jgi:hypothetical protein
MQVVGVSLKPIFLHQCFESFVLQLLSYFALIFFLLHSFNFCLSFCTISICSLFEFEFDFSPKKGGLIEHMP